MTVKYFEDHSAYLCRNSFGMPLIPGDFLVSIFRSESTPSCDIEIELMGNNSQKNQLGLLPLLFVKTEQKKLLKDCNSQLV